jgi:DNA-binding transcriptional ArsR family regulator
MTDLDQIFAALADPTRRALLARLALGETTVGELAKPFDMSLPAISRHLKVLEGALLISNQREGKHRRCRLNARALEGAADWIDFYRSFWTASLDSLELHLKRKKKERSL